MRRWLCVLCTINLLFSNCKKIKEPVAEMPGNSGIDLVTRAIGSAEGFITNEHHQPVRGAIVTFGAASAVTDVQGYFSFDSVSVIKSSAVLTVTYSGYFKAVRNVEVTEGKSAFFRIQLLKAESIGSFSSGSGGSVRHPLGWGIDFLPGSIVNPSNQQLYTGTVTVRAQWLDPTRADLIQVMPGDLRAIDAQGAATFLSSFGMMGVELIGSAGEALQLGNNQKAMLHFPIPSSLQNNAPSRIPLWHFNDNTGLWMEEGFATQTGNSYLGEVSHFSFWNVDIPNLSISVRLKLISMQGQPIPGMLVKLTDAANPAFVGSGLSNASGEVSGYVPKNRTYVLTVFSDPFCTQAVYTQTVQAGDVNLTIPDIVLPSDYTLHLSGRVVDCQFAPVAQGKVMIQANGMYHVLSTSGNGQFGGAIPVCEGGMQAVSLVAKDEIHQQQGTEYSFVLLPGMHALGDIQACGISTNEYMQLVVDSSTEFLLQMPADTLYQNILPNGSISINGFQLPNFNQLIAFNMSASGLAAGSFQPLNTISSHLLPNLSSPEQPTMVAITECGLSGSGYLAGHVAGYVNVPAGNNRHHVQLHFRVHR